MPDLVPVFVSTMTGMVPDGLGVPVGTELVVHGPGLGGTPIGWRVTHRPSGLRVGTFRSKKKALSAARAIHPLFESMSGVSEKNALTAGLDLPAIMATLKHHDVWF